MIAKELTSVPRSPQNQQNQIKNVESQEKKSDQQQQQRRQIDGSRSEKMAADNVGQQQQQQVGERIGAGAKQEPANQPALAAAAVVGATKIQLKQQKFLAAAAKCSAPTTSASPLVGYNKRTAANVSSAQDQHQQQQQATRAPAACSELCRPPSDELAAQLAAVTPLSIGRPISAAKTTPAEAEAEVEAANTTATAVVADSSEPVAAPAATQGLLQQAPMLAPAAAAAVAMAANSSSAPASTHSQRSQQQQQQQSAQSAAAATSNSPAAEVSSLSQQQQQQQQTADAQILIESNERRADFAASKTQTTVVSAELEGERRQRVRIGGSSSSSSSGGGELERRSSSEKDEAQQASQRERLHNFNISNNNNYNQNHHHHNHNHNHNHHHHQHQHHNNNNHNLYHHHNHHHQHQNQHHHNYHQQFHQHQHQSHQVQGQQHNQHQNTMAHYKFHNDCQSSVLTYEQVKRLDYVMDQTVPIHGRGNFPTLYVKLKELIRLVKHKLQTKHSIEIRDVRLNGGAASFVLAPENSHYNDLDLIFGTDLSNEDQFDVIRDVVLECLKEFYPKEQQQQQQQQPQQQYQQQHQHQHQQEEHYFDSEILKETKIAVVKDDGSDCGETNKRANSKSSHSADGNLESAMSESDYDNNDRIGCSDEVVENDNVVDGNGRVVNRLTGSGGFINNQNGARERRSMEESAVNVGEHQQSAQSMQNFQYQHQSYQMPLSNCAIKEAYVHKMVKVNDDDRWSLISLGVQQSEASCCASQSNITTINTNTSNNNCSSMHVGCSHHHHHQQQQQQQQQHQQQQQTSACVNNENEPRLGLINQSSAHMVSNENSLNAQTIVMSNTQQQHYQPLTNYIHQQNQRDHYHQQKQFPNSIELKFVDRMRRKFEFSVDSFQIILDSLLQFYDYAPQSTINSQRKLINSHPSSTMINIRPMINRKRCSVCCANRTVLGCSIANMQRENHNSHHHHQHHHNHHHQNHTNQQLSQQQQTSSNGFSDATKLCSSALNGSRSYYQLPLDSESSPSISSVASSSGCSSSSSVVSSSSSSLSCDEDHDDLYCDADCPSTSSSASTSSLLSSTNSSSLSADGNSGPDEEAALCHFELSNQTSCAVISENFYPTVIGRSEYGNFKEALYHLEKKLIATRGPEEIRGGGLLKYCNLLVKNYKPTNVYQIRTLERYMCSRFFIDFSDLNQQQAKLESYLANHFSDDPVLKFDYLTILHNVVQRSTVCLMNHELRLTLNMIRDLAYKLNEQHHQQQQQQQVSTQQSAGHAQAQPNQHYYYQQKPVLIQSGVYRVKLVNYALAKTVRP